jgi:hypothetical protein
MNSIPLVGSALLGGFWYWKAPPPPRSPGLRPEASARAAFLGAALCWVLALALYYAVSQGTENVVALPGAILASVFGAVCFWIARKARKVDTQLSGGGDAL